MAFLKYIIQKNDNVVNSKIISDIEKKRLQENFYEFYKKHVVVDEIGRLVVDRELINELTKFINERKIPLIMDARDTAISIGEGLPNSQNYNGKLFTSLSDLAAVHVTPIPPMGDTIKTMESSGLTNDMVFVDPSTNIKHNVPYLVGNDTIHFTLNCAVHNHEAGNDWDSYKYGVLVDFSKLDKTKILDVKGEDTYLDGDVEFNSDYFLFCPLGEREKIAKENPKANIIEYDGITLSEAISCMIIFTGRKLEPYGSYGWDKEFEFGQDSYDTQELEKFVTSNGYPVLKGKFGNALHSETKYMARRMWKREYEALVNLIEYNKENNINMPDDILLAVMKYGGAYGLPGNVPVSLEEFKEVVLPILEKHGYHFDDSLFEDINIDSNMKFIYSLSSGERVINCPKWETELRNRIILALKNNIKNPNKKL